MSLILLIDSQAELADGLPWALRIAEQRGRDIELLIVGEATAVLSGHAKTVAKQHPAIREVNSVAENVDSVLEHLRKKNVDLLMLIDDPGHDRLQMDLFERASVPTAWLRSRSEVPVSGRDLVAISPDREEQINRATKRYFGFDAQLTLVDETEAAVLKQLHEADETTDLADRGRALERNRCDAGDLIVAVCRLPMEKDWIAALGIDLLRNCEKASVLLLRRGDPVTMSLSGRLQYWSARVAQPMDRTERVALSESLTEGSQPNLEFLGLISASAMLAAFGLLQDSAAVIIGAMLIAPLMTPILGAGLALAHGNRPLFRAALTTITVGFAGAITASFCFGLLVRALQGVSDTSEMWARCNPSTLDFCVGFVGGIAATYARTRAHLSAALAGAAIAAALVPPIATSGLQLAFGQWGRLDKGWAVGGPLLLVSINVITIMIGSSLVLHARGMSIDRRGSRADRWGLRVGMVLAVLALLFLLEVHLQW